MFIVKVVIYLDQNVLSNLRERKINMDNNQLFRKLKNILKSDKSFVIYSYVTLIEILQIREEEYRKEHIELLEEMNAIYIEPKSRVLRETRPFQIWQEFLENEEENAQLGIDKLIPTMFLSQRKIAGLPIAESFVEINDKLKQELSNLMLGSRNNILQLDLDKELEGIDESVSTSIKQYLLLADKMVDFYLEQISKIEIPDIDESNLGVQPFRTSPDIKSLDVEKIPPEYVVRVIENIFNKDNKDFKLSDYVEETIQNRISYAYELMNWVGYHADDFTKIKKGKDRFNASKNDMMHVVSAVGSSFLISGDIPFLKKAYASYCFVNSETIVCTPEELVNNYDFNL